MRLLQLGCASNVLNEFVFTPAKSDAQGAVDQSGDCQEAVAQNVVPFASEAHVCASGETNGDDHVNGIGAKSTSSGVTGAIAFFLIAPRGFASLAFLTLLYLALFRFCVLL